MLRICGTAAFLVSKTVPPPLKTTATIDRRLSFYQEVKFLLFISFQDVIQ